MVKLRVLVVDDHSLMRSTLRSVIDWQQDMEVIAEAADGSEAIAQARRLTPDVTLLDVSMPGMPGIEVAQQLKRAVPRMKILALSAHEDEDHASRMLSMGADGYATKSTSSMDLLDAIRRVAAGERYLDRSIAGKTGGAASLDSVLADASVLTSEEAEVLKQFAQGYPLKQIASTLKLNAVAVERHKKRGMVKLGLKTRADVAHFASAHGWL
ncbi:response regulator transcription factor [Stigmatella hybrida]|uniref:response regulator transcription factor n=1 Tax=Stigmatella hybrida TaxID=394097 RepID=UPI001CDAE3FD|nr:response regulator transcription factor [Stigmatella hybrida]